MLKYLRPVTPKENRMYSFAAQVKKIKGNIVVVGFRNSEEKDNIEASFDPAIQKLEEGSVVSVTHAKHGATVKYEICGGVIKNPGPDWKTR